MGRKEKLQAMLETDSSDPFLHYALAKEFLSARETDAGVAKLKEVVETFPDYHAANFQLAQTLYDIGEPDAAADYLRLGIDAARRQNDTHAVAEMTGMLQMLTGE